MAAFVQLFQGKKNKKPLQENVNIHQQLCSHTGETWEQISFVYCFALMHQHNYHHYDGREVSISCNQF